MENKGMEKGKMAWKRKEEMTAKKGMLKNSKCKTQ